MNNLIFVDFDLIENEKSRAKAIDIINQQSRVILLTENKNNITKAYIHGVEVVIIDAIPESSKEIENALKKYNTRYAYNETTNAIEKMTWDTLHHIKNEKNVSPYDESYIILASIDIPDWMKEHVKTI